MAVWFALRQNIKVISLGVMSSGFGVVMSAMAEVLSFLARALKCLMFLS